MKFPDLLATRAQLDPGKTAIVDTFSDSEISYAWLSDRAGRVAAVLRETYGVRPGDRVALLSGNRSEIFEALFACARIGAVAVPVNWRLSSPELAAIAKDCTPCLVLTDKTHEARAGALADRVVSFDDDQWRCAQEGAQIIADWGGRGADDTWYLLYTSGTTGIPKGVIYTFGMAFANHVNIATAIGLSSDDVTLNVLPTFHTGGINLYTIPTFIAGATAILAHEFDAGVMLRLLSTRATAFFGVPTMYQLLADHPDFVHTEVGRVRSWASGGSSLDIGLVHRLAERGIVVRQGMGMTETGPTLFLIDEATAVSKAGSVGKPQVLAEVKLVDPHGADATEGELLIRGAAITPGYWNRPEANADAFTTDGWLKSGDIARRDDDGYYWIIDRVKDMYISGGENVYPAEIEQVLLSHDDVQEVAVVGVSDQRWGEAGHAIIVSKRHLDSGELKNYCRQNLASYKVPAHFSFVDTLPRNASGKILKRQPMLLAWAEKFTVTQATINDYAAVSGDHNPVHIDAEYGRDSIFGSTIAHGMLVVSLIHTGVSRHHPDRNLDTIDVSFPAPTRAGDTVHVHVSVTGHRLHATVTRDDGTLVCELSGELS